MKKLSFLVVLLFSTLLLIACNKTNEYDFKVDGHDLTNFTEVSMSKDDYLFLIDNLDFNYDQTRIQYFNRKIETKNYTNNRLTFKVVLAEKEKITYTINENEFYPSTFAGNKYFKYESNSSSYGYNTKLLYDGNVYAYDFSNINPSSSSNITSKGRYKSTNGANIILNLKAEQDINLELQAISYFINNDQDFEHKVYTNNNGDFILRIDRDGSIWSLHYDGDYNIISLYKRNDSILTTKIEESSEEKIIFDEILTIFNTQIDLTFDHNNFELIDFINI